MLITNSLYTKQFDRSLTKWLFRAVMVLKDSSHWSHLKIRSVDIPNSMGCVCRICFKKFFLPNIVRLQIKHWRFATISKILFRYITKHSCDFKHLEYKPLLGRLSPTHLFILMCLERQFLCRKLIPHNSQINGRSSKWILRWSISFGLFGNDLSHRSHSKGRSFKWNCFMCWFSCEIVVKLLPKNKKLEYHFI